MPWQIFKRGRPIKNKKRRNIRLKQVRREFAVSRAAIMRSALKQTSTVRAIFGPPKLGMQAL